MSDLLLSYYGDDLTGSTDVMEAMASMACRPSCSSASRRRSSAGASPIAEAIGLAGTSRNETPDWMEAHRPGPRLAEEDARGAVLQVCSTFDPILMSAASAAPARSASASSASGASLVVGAPQLRRYTAFGTLFAAYQGATYRIDRHPVMSRHPVTPMAERRTSPATWRCRRDRPIGLVDLAALQSAGRGCGRRRGPGRQGEIVLVDVADPATQRAVGRQLLRLYRGPSFVAGSSGVEYALLAAWTADTTVPDKAEFASPGKADRIAVVSEAARRRPNGRSAMPSATASTISPSIRAI